MSLFFLIRQSYLERFNLCLFGFLGPSNTDMDATVVIACAGTVTFLALLSHCFRGRGNNDNNEQRPLLNNGLDRPRIEVINNMIK